LYRVRTDWGYQSNLIVPWHHSDLFSRSWKHTDLMLPPVPPEQWAKGSDGFEENLPMSRKSRFKAVEQEEARRRYDSGESKVSIAAYLGISTVTLAKYIRAWDWPARPVRGGAAASIRAAPDDTATTSHDAFPEDNAGPADTWQLAGRVETAVRKQLASIETRISGSGDPADAERNARVLASLVKSLAELGKLETARRDSENAAREANGSAGLGKEGSSGDHAQKSDEQPPRDLAQLREELAARLEKIQLDRSIS